MIATQQNNSSTAAPVEQTAAAAAAVTTTPTPAATHETFADYVNLVNDKMRPEDIMKIVDEALDETVSDPDITPDTTDDAIALAILVIYMKLVNFIPDKYQKAFNSTLRALILRSAVHFVLESADTDDANPESLVGTLAVIMNSWFPVPSNNNPAYFAMQTIATAIFPAFNENTEFFSQKNPLPVIACHIYFMGRGVCIVDTAGPEVTTKHTHVGTQATRLVLITHMKTAGKYTDDMQTMPLADLIAATGLATPVQQTEEYKTALTDTDIQYTKTAPSIVAFGDSWLRVASVTTDLVKFTSASQTTLEKYFGGPIRPFKASNLAGSPSLMAMPFVTRQTGKYKVPGDIVSVFDTLDIRERLITRDVVVAVDPLATAHVSKRFRTSTGSRAKPGHANAAAMAALRARVLAVLNTLPVEEQAAVCTFILGTNMDHLETATARVEAVEGVMQLGETCTNTDVVTRLDDFTCLAANIEDMPRALATTVYRHCRVYWKFDESATGSNFLAQHIVNIQMDEGVCEDNTAVAAFVAHVTKDVLCLVKDTKDIRHANKAINACGGTVDRSNCEELIFPAPAPAAAGSRRAAPLTPERRAAVLGSDNNSIAMHVYTAFLNNIVTGVRAATGEFETEVECMEAVMALLEKTLPADIYGTLSEASVRKHVQPNPRSKAKVYSASFSLLSFLCGTPSITTKALAGLDWFTTFSSSLDHDNVKDIVAAVRAALTALADSDTVFTDTTATRARRAAIKAVLDTDTNLSTVFQHFLSSIKADSHIKLVLNNKFMIDAMAPSSDAPVAAAEEDDDDIDLADPKTPVMPDDAVDTSVAANHADADVTVVGETRTSPDDETETAAPAPAKRARVMPESVTQTQPAAAAAVKDSGKGKGKRIAPDGENEDEDEVPKTRKTSEKDDKKAAARLASARTNTWKKKADLSALKAAVASLIESDPTVAAKAEKLRLGNDKAKHIKLLVSHDVSYESAFPESDSDEE